MAKKKERFKPAMARCLKLCGGNIPAALVMYRLIFWKASIEHNGRKWIAKSHEDLIWETELSMGQVKTAVSYLRSQGWIDIERHLFAGRNLNHYLVTAKFRKAFEEFGALDQVDLKPLKEEHIEQPFEEAVG